MKMQYVSQTSTRGFTLIELMVVLAIIGITAMIALPQMSQLTQSNKMTEQINLLSRDLAYARSEAITRGTRIDVTSNAGGWHNGWTIFDNTPAIPQQLRQAPAFNTANITVREAANLVSVQFRPNGSVNNPLDLRLCDATTTDVGKAIQLGQVGRIQAFSAKFKNGANVCP